MRGKPNIKLYGTCALLYMGNIRVGSISYDKHEAKEHEGWTEHIFHKHNTITVKIQARGGKDGTP